VGAVLGHVLNLCCCLLDLIVEIEETRARGEPEWFFIEAEVFKYIHIPLSIDIL
jgi:hypothetical protein